MSFVASAAQNTVNLQLKWSIPKKAAMWDTLDNSTSDCKSALRLQRQYRFRDQHGRSVSKVCYVGVCALGASFLKRDTRTGCVCVCVCVASLFVALVAFSAY